VPGNRSLTKAAQEAAEPDGNTLILGHIGTLAVNPYMFPKLPYDVNRDFVPLTLLAQTPTVFVVGANVPAKDLKEFVALAKQKPGQLTYGSAGNGSAGHLAFEYLKLVTGIDVTHVPYKGTARRSPISSAVGPTPLWSVRRRSCRTSNRER
jgi:tripartite-type tricarboxylate transporter receptor subunit TctC